MYSAIYSILNSYLESSRQTLYGHSVLGGHLVPVFLTSIYWVVQRKQQTLWLKVLQQRCEINSTCSLHMYLLSWYSWDCNLIGWITCTLSAIRVQWLEVFHIMETFSCNFLRCLKKDLEIFLYNSIPKNANLRIFQYKQVQISNNNSCLVWFCWSVI